MLSRTDTHRAHTGCHCSRLHFIFVRKLTCSEPNSRCVCVCVSWGALIRSTSTANTTTNQWDPEKWQWMRKRENVHSSTAFPTRAWVCVCVCCLNTAQWMVCVWSHWQLHYGWCAQGDSTIQGKERRGQRHRRDRHGLLLGRPTSVQLLVEEGGRRWEEGGQLLSPLMSLCFFHQLSIYRAVQHSCPSTHTRRCNTHSLKPSCFSQVDSQEKSVMVKLICQLPLIRPSHLGREVTPGWNVTRTGPLCHHQTEDAQIITLKCT